MLIAKIRTLAGTALATLCVWFALVPGAAQAVFPVEVGIEQFINLGSTEETLGNEFNPGNPTPSTELFVRNKSQQSIKKITLTLKNSFRFRQSVIVHPTSGSSEVDTGNSQTFSVTFDPPLEQDEFTIWRMEYRPRLTENFATAMLESGSEATLDFDHSGGIDPYTLDRDFLEVIDPPHSTGESARKLLYHDPSGVGGSGAFQGRLTVTSRIGTGDNPLTVPGVAVAVLDDTGAPRVDFPGAGLLPEGGITFLDLTEGDVVRVTARERVLANRAEDSSPNFNTKDDPWHRFTVEGIQVRDQVFSNGPTVEFTFGDKDTSAAVQWRHEVAVKFSQDLTGTRPMGNDAAPLVQGLSSSDALTIGNPSVIRNLNDTETQSIAPILATNWVPINSALAVEIEPVKTSFELAPQNVRYVLYETTIDAAAPQSQTTDDPDPVRIFPGMPDALVTGPVDIGTKWRVEYGLQLGVQGSGSVTFSSTKPGIGPPPPSPLVPPAATFWSQPDATVVVKAKKQGTQSGKDLNGWLTGDGYYFDILGILEDKGSTQDITTGLAPGVNPIDASKPRGTLINNTIDFGISIPKLKRPLAVTFTYGPRTVTTRTQIGDHVFQTQAGGPDSKYKVEPVSITPPDAAVWDVDNQRLYPVIPGRIELDWGGDKVFVVAELRTTPHYTYVAGSPAVALDVDSGRDDQFQFQRLTWTSHEAQVDAENRFFAPASSKGESVLYFLQPNPGRNPSTTVRVRQVRTELWQDEDQIGSTKTEVLVGKALSSPSHDKAALGTGYVVNPRSRFNTRIYDAEKLDGLQVSDVYNFDATNNLPTYPNATTIPPRKKANLPGRVFPVNEHPNAEPSDYLVVVWYDDPTTNDHLLWPHKAVWYIPKWILNEGQSTEQSAEDGWITIASEFGSESSIFVGTGTADAEGAFPDSDERQQKILDPDPAQEGESGEFTSYDPIRFQDLQVYQQPDPSVGGYNPNEEHALIAPSLRFSDVSPRPAAVYALRTGDINTTDKTAGGGYTSDAFVLAQFFNVVTQEHDMRVYGVRDEQTVSFQPPEATAATDVGYRFAQNTLLEINATGSSRGLSMGSPSQLFAEPHVTMEAGEPVIPFYPLGVVNGATPCPETFGTDLRLQRTYWEDHRGTNWSVSGGDNAWFSTSFSYRLRPEFWWPEDAEGNRKSGVIVESRTKVTNPDKTVTETVTRSAAAAQVGSCIAFLPSGVDPLLAADPGDEISTQTIVNDAPDPISWATGFDAAKAEGLTPTQILYKSDWPEVAPVLKAGETMTFQGGEFRTDHPTTVFVDRGGITREVETPGLPGIVGFASAEVVFDSLNPQPGEDLWTREWTGRVAQVLEKRSVELPLEAYPAELKPASGRVRVSQGKYIFNELPASLQRRIRYDAVRGQLHMSGLLNDKDIAEPTLTAAPPAVYALEPNILTEDDRTLLQQLDNGTGTTWDQAVDALFQRTRNPGQIDGSSSAYFVGLEQEIERNKATGLPELKPIEPGSDVMIPRRRPNVAAPLRGFGPGLALIPNDGFLDPEENYQDVSWVTVVENNDPSLGGSPITPHVIKVDRRERYRGSIKTIESDNVFDENLVLRHTGDFGAHADELFYEWWYRPDDGQLDVAPPDRVSPGAWLLFPDPTGAQGRGMYEVTMKGNPNAPETLLADTFWFVRYRHENDVADGTDWEERQPDGSDEVNFTWAGAGNSDPFNDFDLDGAPDFRAQLAQGWIKRVLDAVNPYEARIRDFETDNPSTRSSMLSLFGPRFEGPVALNPDKNVIENVGLIELYETVLRRGRELSVDLTRPISTPAIANALQLASTRISDLYTVLGHEAYTDSLDPTIGFGSDSVEYGSLAPAVFTFQNQMSSVIGEELGLLRGVDDFFARPVYNRLFWNFTKGEGEAAYALNYNISDINADGFIDEDDAMMLYPQGHGDAWGHYLTALRNQYELLGHPAFNWVSRSEFYNLQDIVLKVDFLDERKFAGTAAAKAKAGAEIVDLTYRDAYVEDPDSQWQGYTDANEDRAWGVDGWATRAGQGAYFDWVTANALLPSEHPNETLEGIQKVDRTTNSDIAVISAQMNRILRTFDEANGGQNPLGLAGNVVPFDIDPARIQRGQSVTATHFEQVYNRAVAALGNAVSVWDNANQTRNMLRKIANSEREFRNKTFQEDLSYRNRLIKIFGRPYEGTIGSGGTYPPGYDGPDALLYMYVNTREITDDTVPGPTLSFAEFDGNQLAAGEIYRAFVQGEGGPRRVFDIGNGTRALFAPTLAFQTDTDTGFTDAVGDAPIQIRDGWYDVEYTELETPKVDLDNFAQLMPVTASGYTFQAPDAWGSRLATGELQVVIGKMIQQEARVASAIGAWDALTGEIGREFRLLNARRQLSKEKQDFLIARQVVDVAIKEIFNAFELARAIKDANQKLFTSFFKDLRQYAVPTGDAPQIIGNSPGGVIFTPGAITLDQAQRANLIIEETIKTGKLAAFQVSQSILEEALSTIDLDIDARERSFGTKEALIELEGLFGDEPIKRIEVFREIETLRELSERYVTLLDEGSRLIDERLAFNKRVAAQTQRNRYQDMTFRVSRNHALQTYRDASEVAARYAFLAAKAYDYETNFPSGHPGSPELVLQDIVAARSLGHFEGGQPRLGKGGLGEALAWLKANYEVQKGQLGFNNPQTETGKISLRTELLRILPKSTTTTPATQPSSPPADLEIPSPGDQSDPLWRTALEQARVDDLWEVPEFRHYCRPFAASEDASGNHVAQPGLVFRFPTSILAGKNFFGKRLAGGDHAYDASNFATKVRSVGVWLSGYQSEDLLQDLAEAPRVYLVPAGADIMRVPDGGDNTDLVRIWDVVDQKIPVPLPSRASDLEDGNWIPLLDGLNGRLGDPRRLSSFRAYHDSSETLIPDELVFDSRLVGRSVWNTQWLLIIPGQTLNADADGGLDKFIYGPGADPAQPDGGVSDIKLIFQTYGYSGG